MTDCDIECFRSPPSTFPNKIGDGIHRVGWDIVAGTYTIGTPSDPSSCEWERLSDLEGSPNQVAESGEFTAGRQVTIGEDDAGFYTSGCGTWTVQTEP